MYTSGEYAPMVGKPGRVVNPGAELTDPHMSRIGGRAAWHDEDTAPHEPLLCGYCGRGSKMLLVCQIYAPTDRPRSLYIFCCNRRLCSLSSLGWTVIRNQAKEVTQQVVAATTATISSAAPTATVGSVWSFLGDQFSDTADSGGNVDMLEKMLCDRDGAPPAPTPAPAATVTAAALTPATATAAAVQAADVVAMEWRPCRRIVELEDTWAGKALHIDGDDQDPDQDDDENDDFTASAASDAHIHRMLQGYLADDPDEELSLMLASASTISLRESSSSDVKHKKESTKPKGDDEERAGWVKKLSRNTMVAKTEQYFQRRIATEPQQVMRYAYGGQPLWCTHPPPAGAAAPGDCKGCGSRRLFELQLMPALLAQGLRAVLVKGSDANAAATHEGDEKGEEEIDGGAECGGGKPKAAEAGVGELEAAAEKEAEELKQQQQQTAAMARASSGEEEINDDEEEDGPGTAESYAKPSDSQIAAFMKRLGDDLDFGVVTVWCCPNSCPAGTEEVVVVQHPSDMS